jgi:hypothetical protein
MNEIKFRLVKEGKIVGYESHIIDPNIGHIGIYHKKVGETRYKYGYPVTMGDVYYIYHDEKEQYTNKKDKNGRKIYLGDIIKSNDGEIATVVSENGELSTKEWAFKPIFDWWEVIGNIHDTPELLEKVE